MNIAHVADIHLTDRKDDSRATLEEQVELCRWIGEHAAQHGAEIMLVAGDIFDHVSTPAMRNAAIQIFRRWAGTMPVVAIRGNCTHDRPGDILFLGQIHTRRDIFIHERSVIMDLPALSVACIPWPTKAGLAGAIASQQDVDDAAQQAMQAVLRGFAAEWPDGLTKPRVILAHAELGSATMDTGQQVLAHADLPLHAQNLLDTGADYVALGHIHKHQVIDDHICYAGSIRQTAFGQDNIKGYCLVDVKRGEPPAIQHVKAPGRDLVTYDGEFTSANPDTLVFGVGSNQHLGDAVRLKYTATEDQRERARHWADEYKTDLLKGGAHSVKIDATVMPSTRVRSETIRIAKTLSEKMEAYWQSREERPDRTESIFEKLREMESEVTI